MEGAGTITAAREEVGGRPPLAGTELTFLPGDPPRCGQFAAFRLHNDQGQELADDAIAALGQPGMIELALPTGTSVRRRRVPAVLLPVASALPLLLDVEASPTMTATARLWASVVTAGLGLVARGRLRPAVSPNGLDAWRAGPLGPDDRALQGHLAEAMPPLAYAVPLESASSPLRVHSPTYLVAAVWDALADTLPRTAGAGTMNGPPLFAATEPTPASQLRPWLEEASAGLDGGASFALRVHLGDASDPDPRAVLQISSLADPSLVVDAAELFSMPAAVLARFGEEAERDLLLALRRGARAWAPVSALLDQQIPDALELDDDLLADLLLDGATELASAGIGVLWPSELLVGGLSLRAVMTTPTPATVTEGGFDLGSLVDFHYELTVDGDALSAAEVDLLAEAKRGLVRIRGRFVAVDSALIAKAQERRSRRVAAAAALGALLGGKLEVDGELVDIVADGAVAEMAERLGHLSAGDLASLAPPAGLLAELRPYQLRGLAWLAGMTKLGLGGCLADDMGLGKTVQVIALHLHRMQDHDEAGLGPAPPMLVVCPTSLLGNWERELHKFAPSVPVRRFHGGERHLGHLAPGEVVLTTYGVLRREKAALAKAGFALVVADEAQHAKNPLSGTAKSLRAIPAQARVALTGTPVENRLTELWSVLDWTTPGLLGPLERFRRTVAVAVERNHDREATARLANAVRPFLLRRKKTDPDIAPDLPERTVTDLAVPLTTEQVSLYEAEVREALDAIATKKGIERQGLVLRLMTVLKQICNHPAQYLHQAGPIPGRSGKLAALDELLEVVVGAGDSVLVFSQFVEMCRLIEAHLATLQVPTLFLHGGVPARKREEMVARFQAGNVPVFLLSLKAGGVGLNLTQATHVIHYDRWWNPAVEDQASDRAHRIGQRRAVQVHRLVCEGTLEDRVAQLLETKRALAESVVGQGEAWVGDLSDSELAALVSLGPLRGRKMSWWPPPSKRLPGPGPRRAGRKPFGATWWGKAWVDALEQRAELDRNRLPRGRTYARTGAVGEIGVRAGAIMAAVQGSRAKPYKVTVKVRTFSDQEWEVTLSALARRAGHMAALLDGEMPPGVADDLAAAHIELLPVAGELQPRCSCPDWANPCKHAAAVCYLVADTLDADPFLLFLMRGRGRDTLLAELRARRAAAGAAVTGGGGQPGERRRRGAGADGADGGGTDQANAWAPDAGVAAREAWARWAALTAQGVPALPAIPLPPPRPGRPTVLAVDPPPGSGLTSASLLQLAADAALRAWELAHGETAAEIYSGDAIKAKKS